MVPQNEDEYDYDVLKIEIESVDLNDIQCIFRIIPFIWEYHTCNLFPKILQI